MCKRVWDPSVSSTAAFWEDKVGQWQVTKCYSPFLHGVGSTFQICGKEETPQWMCKRQADWQASVGN